MALLVLPRVHPQLRPEHPWDRHHTSYSPGRWSSPRLVPDEGRDHRLFVVDTEQLLPARLRGDGPSQGLQAELWPRLRGRHEDQRGVAGHQPPCGHLRGQHCVVPAAPQTCLSSPPSKAGSPPGMSPVRGPLGQALGSLGESGTPQGGRACASAAASPSPCGWRPEITAWTSHPLPRRPVPLPTHPQGNAGPKLSPRTPPPPPVPARWRAQKRTRPFLCCGLRKTHPRPL